MKFSPTAILLRRQWRDNDSPLLKAFPEILRALIWEAQTPDPNAEWPCCVVHCGGLREQVVELSNQHLVDVLDFYFQGNQAHWNKTPTPSNS